MWVFLNLQTTATVFIYIYHSIQTFLELGLWLNGSLLLKSQKNKVYQMFDSHLQISCRTKEQDRIATVIHSFIDQRRCDFVSLSP